MIMSLSFLPPLQCRHCGQPIRAGEQYVISRTSRHVREDLPGGGIRIRNLAGAAETIAHAACPAPPADREPT